MKLWEPIKCCCCFDRRNGSLIIGSLFLISGCLNLFGSLKSLIVPNTQEIEELCRGETEIPDCQNLFRKIMLGTSLTTLTIACLHITFSILLIHGIMKKKTTFLVPMMVMYLIQIFLILVASLIVVGFFMYFGIWVMVIVFAIVFGLIIFLETYFLLVIRAYYFDMKRDKGQIHMALNEGNYPVPYSDVKPPPQY